MQDPVKVQLYCAMGVSGLIAVLVVASIVYVVLTLV